MTSIFEGQPPKTRRLFQPKQGAPFRFPVCIPKYLIPPHCFVMNAHNRHQPTDDRPRYGRTGLIRKPIGAIAPFAFGRLMGEDTSPKINMEPGNDGFQ